jgi:pimeloyl-ACP methyl ester carboxylesterase
MRLASRRGLRPLLALAWLIASALGTAASAESEPGSVRFPVRFETSDGFMLHGDLVSAADVNAPVAILLHMYRSNRGAWAPLVPRLVEAGFTVLALDQRAHGESVQQGDRTLKVEQLTREQFSALVREGAEDVQAARRFLKERGIAVDRIALVGASYGCTVSLLASGSVEGVRALSLLSPGTSYFGVNALAPARRFRGSLLAIAAEDDPRAVESARRIAGAHPGEHELVIYPSGGHGTRLFSPRPEVMDRVVEFLDKALR